MFRKKRDDVNVLCKPADCARESGMEILRACSYANLHAIKCKAWHDMSAVVTCRSRLKPKCLFSSFSDKYNACSRVKSAAPCMRSLATGLAYAKSFNEWTKMRARCSTASHIAQLTNLWGTCMHMECKQISSMQGA